MKKALAVLLSCAMFLTGCSLQDAVDTSSEQSSVVTENETESSASSDTDIQASDEEEQADSPLTAEINNQMISIDTSTEEYINTLGFTSLKDQNLLRYVEDSVYTDLLNQLDSDKYFVENVKAIYISKEYLDELAYNSQENIYFGYKLSDLDQIFQGEKYIFTLGENGQTDVIPFEEYDDTYDQVIRNVAIGTGVILLCVTVSVVTGGLGAPAVSMIFAASAKTATAFALSSGVISGVSAGVVEGMETHDFEKAVKAAALKGSEGYMWGAITGAVTGGAAQGIELYGATLNGLTMNEAALIQKESKYPLDVIKQFKNMDQYKICKEAGLIPRQINGKTALIRNIDINYIDDATGMSNLQLMLEGKAPIDPASGLPYELHHIGQKVDSTLAILTKAEHMQNGNNKIWHIFDKASEVYAQGNTWSTQRADFWKAMASMFAG
ncbi:MAG: hypothetical protein IKN85_11045 [Oscillospiraceae bacterium]|nr:hypothetical protein [Oscillospiraceae bacterium]